ncbi:MAG: AI-2E family transporter [Chloroflexota bacterium]|nr:AI-2E family transporter [Chloroflexota bacterium]
MSVRVMRRECPAEGAVRSRRRLPLALPTFIGAYVPIVGAFVAGLAAVLVALVALGTAGGTGRRGGGVAVQQVESNFFQPVVVGRSVHVHPVSGRDPPRGDGRSRAGQHHRRDHRHADRRASRRPCCGTFASSDLRARTPPAEATDP